ncbi:inorganic pyrophosphatase TTM2 [Trifolium repens]|nr:inorganic pyrophosphatase TTM2 [Trifolium repens]
MLSIIPPPLQAEVEYSYHRLSRLMLNIVPPPLQAEVEYSYHRLSRLMLSIVPPPLQADNHLWFKACDYECSCTLIAFLISFITNRNLSRRTTITSSPRTILLEVTRFLTIVAFELATTITLWPRLGPMILSFPFASVLASTPHHIQPFRTIINLQVFKLGQLFGSQSRLDFIQGDGTFLAIQQCILEVFI